MRKGPRKRGSDSGALAYFLELMENLRSGAWRENTRQYEGPPA